MQLSSKASRKPSNHPPKRRYAEAIRASRRASRRARLEPNRYTQAVWHAAGLAANHPPKRRYAEAIRASRRPAAGPVSNRNEIRKPPGTPPGLCRTNRRERAVGQYAGPVSIRTIRRGDLRKPSGSRRASVEPSAEATRASRRAAAGHASNHPPKRRYAEAIRASRRASRRARDERATEHTTEVIRASRRAAAGQAPSTERSAAAEPQRSNRTP